MAMIGSYTCIDTDNNDLGYSSVEPKAGEEHYFGDVLYICQYCLGMMAVFEKALEDKQYANEETI